MAETAKPTTEDIFWPQFKITPKGLMTPGMIFGNSSTPGSIDFSVCKLWAQVDTMLDASNATSTATPSSSSGKPSASATNGAATITPTTKISVALGLLVMAATMVA